MCDSNSVEHAAIQFGALLVLQETDRDVPQSDLAETLLLMMMPKKNHTKSSFWRDPKIFMARLIPLLDKYPKINENMIQAVRKDTRLTSTAGIYTLDFERALEDLKSLILARLAKAGPQLGVAEDKIKFQQFKNSLRNHYAVDNNNANLPLQSIYNGIAKLVVGA